MLFFLYWMTTFQQLNSGSLNVLTLNWSKDVERYTVILPSSSVYKSVVTSSTISKVEYKEEDSKVQHCFAHCKSHFGKGSPDNNILWPLPSQTLSRHTHQGSVVIVSSIIVKCLMRTGCECVRFIFQVIWTWFAYTTTLTGKGLHPNLCVYMFILSSYVA